MLADPMPSTTALPAEVVRVIASINRVECVPDSDVIASVESEEAEDWLNDVHDLAPLISSFAGSPENRFMILSW